MLSKVPPTKKGKSKFSNLRQEVAFENYPSKLSVEDLIYLQENFNGSRLTNQLRKKLPGIIPTLNEERIRKDQYNREFEAILLPERTATGWKVDPSHLIEILCFRYYWLSSIKHWCLYGDGRQIGGRCSTYLGISILNNEAFLHGVSFQSLKEMFPISIFYEKDSRNNLEENPGYPNSKLNAFIAKEVEKGGSKFYLTGDEMFFEAMLGGDGVLDPTSDTGWNTYHECMPWNESKKITGKDGLRTSLSVNIDRTHPSAILNAIPIENHVFCILHAVARCVEKLLNLVVLAVISESNISSQNHCANTFVKTYLISNLENNINRRGVRQGQFRIHFDKSGKPEPVKLNKDHALAIISPTPAGLEHRFPHVLHNVSSSRLIATKLSSATRAKLSLKLQYTHKEIEKEIWDNFYMMVTILKSDPYPELLEGKLEGSKKAEDYAWGYSQSDITQYIKYAECFYQLFVLRYTFTNLTPYMMKLIDLAPLLMERLPFSRGRFQSEAGEHANYEHNCFYYQHTTRHGGLQKIDPIVSVFRNMYKRLTYSIREGDGTEESCHSRQMVDVYVKRHLYAKQIQRWNLGHFKVIRKQGKATNVVTTEVKDFLFRGMNFVLCGAVPKLIEQKFTQAEFSELLKANGGKVRNSVSESKLSTKKFVFLSGKSHHGGKKTLPSSIKFALRHGHPVVDYTFIIETIKAKKLQEIEKYRINFPSWSSHITKQVSLEERHFSKAKKMTSIIKSKRKKKWRLKSKQRKHIGNPCLHFVWRKMREAGDKQKMSFAQNTALLSKRMKEWKALSVEDKARERDEWKNEIRLKRFLLSKNKLDNPAYMKYIS
ncbi:hypothetical protein HOLleu_43290 [Holothuria leucospilota]|uniref:BRCT domain-containing protein n=1 Tax=Holothuria leucospilota TaxID=206669 RepID=A0A9Q0YEK9_HOLLE|nr:hypothetical protein HOLleu_43290 [Holothuria leucospilota]